MIRTVLASLALLAAASTAHADQVFTLFTGAPEAVVCVGTESQPARYGGLRADRDGAAALYFPTRESNRSLIESYQVTIASIHGGAVFTIARSELENLTMPELDPGLSPSCGVMPVDAESSLSADARQALRRQGLDGWPFGYIEPTFALPLQIRLTAAHDNGALTASRLCSPDSATCLTNAGVAAHNSCCERYPGGQGCVENQRSRTCRAEYELAADRYHSLFSWAVEPGAAQCAPTGTVLPRDEINQCCADRYRSMSEAEAVWVYAANDEFGGAGEVDLAELFVCDPEGNRYNL